MTFEIIAMICALGQGPRECVPQTARSTFKVGEESNELACMRAAQMGAGKLSFRLRDDETWKFMCVRKSQ